MYSRLSTSLVAELIGTFALIFIGAGAGALGIGGLVGVALAHGLVVVGFAYAYGHISGTHINPAVTLGVWAAGKIETARAFSYIIFQIVGGVLAALALRWILGGAETGLGATRLAHGLTVGSATINVTPVVGDLTDLWVYLVGPVLGGVAAGLLYKFVFEEHPRKK